MADMSNVKRGLAEFCSKYMMETLTLVAIVLGAVSSWLDLFVGKLGWSVLFMVIGCGVGLLLPKKVDAIAEKVYSFSCGSNQTTMWISQGAKIAIALFIPFIYFLFLGVMTGTAYEYYIHRVKPQNEDNKAA